jgi:dihydroorotate dehydrogenase electron transfer subunit
VNRVLAPLGRRLAEVCEYRRVGAYDILVCDDPDGPEPDPGQFYMLAAAERWGGGDGERPFLPRAFSVMRRSEGRLEFMLEDVGPGTHRLGELRAGDGLWLAGPFGIGFAKPRRNRRPILVGGGVGAAPLAIWQDALGASTASPGDGSSSARPLGGSSPASPRVLLGFRDGEHAEGAALLGASRIATDDGSAGHKGPVTDLLRAELGYEMGGPDSEVYACGPPAMLEAVRAICAAQGAPAQLALEAGMACGYGACFGCVVPTKSGYVRLCVDGPVLDAAELDHVGRP